MKGKVFRQEDKKLLKEAGIEYAVSIGRRQPMHKMHRDSINEIIEEGLKLVLVAGSTNTAVKDNGEQDRLFDPISNPLSFNQQKEQFFSAFSDLSEEDAVIIPFDDIGNLSLWSENLAKLLKEKGILEKSVLHFRGKEQDKGEVKFFKDSKEIILKNSWQTDALRYFGLSIWYSENPSADDYKIDSSALRAEQLEKNKNILATPDYLINITNQAREENPDKDKLQNVPVTMFDLSLKRMKEEADITLSEITRNLPDNFKLPDLIFSAKNLLKKNC